jgi:hypothetical protein
VTYSREFKEVDGGGYLVECCSSLDVKRRTGAVDCGGKRNRAGPARDASRSTFHE